MQISCERRTGLTNMMCIEYVLPRYPWTSVCFNCLGLHASVSLGDTSVLSYRPPRMVGMKGSSKKALRSSGRRKPTVPDSDSSSSESTSDVCDDRRLRRKLRRNVRRAQRALQVSEAALSARTLTGLRRSSKQLAKQQSSGRLAKKQLVEKPEKKKSGKRTIGAVTARKSAQEKDNEELEEEGEEEEEKADDPEEEVTHLEKGGWRGRGEEGQEVGRGESKEPGSPSRRRRLGSAGKAVAG